ncbi:hypothetical protein BABINDRAFT_15287 [Babjeviella inositovora NRRL Y-12698]|uniref:Uncharacterized protein n=1 Tax=Babjeviella inositovora NRRL Y-12698 TaxID=984486 RepID=A0A1E3QIV5_9ASCO|nr:uncharacterized protein BABINDRAFT_15287 [Babjeviella inositovora NRRL Y-12698]ODQ77580.1 hypothetical protein BABINDRAFT_15287 [Babjeviella inositovora NRRL Y-12698]
MRASQILFSAQKKSGFKLPFPVELTPLAICTALACGSLAFFTTKHFAGDQELRLRRNPELSILEETIKKHEDN